MRKVLIGICNIGNGHFNRQKCVIQRLLCTQGTKILVATDKEKGEKLCAEFPEIHTTTVFIPWISCSADGINYKDTLTKYKEQNADLFDTFLSFCISVEDYFDGKPDIAITDYEPNVAQYAYSAGIPLITMEQQSKFLYLDPICVPGQSFIEEHSRLNYFFPSFSLKIISSFFPLFTKEKNVIFMPPIIQQIAKAPTIQNLIVVYFSPYANSSRYMDILDAVHHISGFSFHVFAAKPEEYFEKYPDIHFHSFSEDFLSTLSSAAALLSTAGHQLISEAISIDLPMLLFPLDTYEQHYNSHMVQKYGLGQELQSINKDAILNFIGKLPEYRKNIREFRHRYYLQSWEEIFDAEVNRFFAGNE